jgi:hypothetical protein
MKHQTIIQTRLSSGQLMYIEKLGRKYAFVICSLELGVAPDIIQDLSKAEAMEAYTTHLEADVCDLWHAFLT